MTTVSTKHKPSRDTPIPMVREVELPLKIEKAEHEGNAVSLGAREPEEGRYTTLSRITYQPGARRRPGEPPVEPRPHDTIYNEAHSHANEMRARHFYMDEPPKVLISEYRGALAPPPPGTIRSMAQHNRDNALLMNSHNMFIGEREKQQWMRATSTNRASYHEHDTATLADIQQNSRKFRSLQQASHFALGTIPPDWKSESRANYTGAQEKVKTTLCKDNVASTINIGSRDTDVKDTLRSLKQIDYVPHRAAPYARATCLPAQQTNMVLGFCPNDIQSLHRASYTPTVFVDPRKATASPVLPGSASGMGSSPQRAPAARPGSKTPGLPAL